MYKLSGAQWKELNQQMSITPSDTDPEGAQGEHMKLIALLNGFGLNPTSRQEAVRLGRELLEAGWIEEF